MLKDNPIRPKMLTMENMDRRESNIVIKKRPIDESIVIDSPLLAFGNSSNEYLNTNRIDEDTVVDSERSNPVGIPNFKEIQPMNIL